MHSKQAVKWMALVVVLVSMSVAAIPGTADEPQGVDPEAISCGDSATCSMSGTALYVKNTGSGTAIYGNSMANGIGVRAKGSPGVYGYSYHGTGVRGKSENGYGVKAQSTNSYGLWAESDSSAAIRAQGYAAGPDLLLAGDSSYFPHGQISSDPTYSSSDIYLTAYDDVMVHLDEDNTAENGCMLFYRGDNSEFYQICEGGGTSVAGTQAVVVGTSSGSREVYAMGSPGNWFEDFGSAALVDGQATVTIDHLFRETVNTDDGYHVFLTPLGECSGLYVADKTPSSFEVRELGGGAASIAFDFRIVAKRRGYEGQRLESSSLASAEDAGP